jgi:hypothetical protein
VILLRAVDAVQDVLKRHKLGYTLLIAGVVVVGSGLLVATIEEASPERNIESIPDGLWWPSRRSPPSATGIDSQ